MDKLKQQFSFPPNKPLLKKQEKKGISGWLAVGNQLLLKKYLSMDMKIIFEFGSWLGMSAKYMLNRTSENCIIVCVDWWKGDTSIGYQEDEDELYNTFLSNMWNYRDRVIPVRIDGRKGVKLLSSLGIKPDMIYLDMDHSYESAKGDLKILMDHFSDVLILGDDILYWSGVAKAVKETVHDYKVHRLEIQQNCYALVPKSYDLRYELKSVTLNIIEPQNDIKVSDKVAIIIGFKDGVTNEKSVKTFITYITDFMKKTKLQFHLFIIKQHNETKLNLGKLYNIGFDIADKLDYNVFIFHNIYLLPNVDMLGYYKTYPVNPIQLGYHKDGYIYQKQYFGTFMISYDSYEKLNGMPNNISGWIGWDNEFNLRIKTTETTIDIPLDGSLKDNGDIKLYNKCPIFDKVYWNKNRNKSIIDKHSNTWNMNGLHDLQYSIRNHKEVSKYHSIYEVVI